MLRGEVSVPLLLFKVKDKFKVEWLPASAGPPTGGK